MNDKRKAEHAARIARDRATPLGECTDEQLLLEAFRRFDPVPACIPIIGTDCWNHWCMPNKVLDLIAALHTDDRADSLNFSADTSGNWEIHAYPHSGQNDSWVEFHVSPDGALTTRPFDMALDGPDFVGFQSIDHAFELLSRWTQHDRHMTKNDANAWATEQGQ